MPTLAKIATDNQLVWVGCWGGSGAMPQPTHSHAAADTYEPCRGRHMAMPRPTNVGRVEWWGWSLLYSCFFSNFVAMPRPTSSHAAADKPGEPNRNRLTGTDPEPNRWNRRHEPNRWNRTVNKLKLKPNRIGPNQKTEPNRTEPNRIRETNRTERTG